jgi:hypothetical protein
MFQSGNFQSIQVDAFREHVYVHAPTEHAQTEMVAVPLLIAPNGSYGALIQPEVQRKSAAFVMHLQVLEADETLC